MDQAVVGPDATFVPGEQACFGEDPQVVADGRLRESERCGQVDDACFAVVGGLDEAQQPEPGRVCEGFEDTGQAAAIGSPVQGDTCGVVAVFNATARAFMIPPSLSIYCSYGHKDVRNDIGAG
jgi:hypothetical protein